jgi:hypothetical protein
MTRTARRGWCAAALAALAVLPAAANGQVVIRRFGGGSSGGMRWLDAAPAQYGVQAWKAGEWARYSVSESMGGPMPMVQYRSISVVGRRGDAFWLETADEFGGMTSGRGATRKLLVPFGAVVERVGVESYVMGPDSSVRRQTVLREAPGPTPHLAFPEGWTRAGEEAVTTPAGNIQSVHWRKGAEELWTAASAGPLGLVRYRSADVEIELVGHGESGARSQIPFGGN